LKKQQKTGNPKFHAMSILTDLLSDVNKPDDFLRDYLKFNHFLYL